MSEDTDISRREFLERAVIASVTVATGGMLPLIAPPEAQAATGMSYNEIVGTGSAVFGITKSGKAYDCSVCTWLAAARIQGHSQAKSTAKVWSGVATDYYTKSNYRGCRCVRLISNGALINVGTKDYEKLISQQGFTVTVWNARNQRWESYEKTGLGRLSSVGVFKLPAATGIYSIEGQVKTTAGQIITLPAVVYKRV